MCVKYCAILVRHSQDIIALALSRFVLLIVEMSDIVNDNRVAS
jgi:hypothetical protein